MHSSCRSRIRKTLSLSATKPHSHSSSSVITGDFSSSSTGKDECYTLSALVVNYSESIKKSRFLVFAHPITSLAHGLTLVHQLKDNKASHNCWAMRMSPTEHRVSDDGEPSGTAGRPILTALDSLHYTRLLLLVTRHFGGIKLGTGGLIRAYSSVAKNALLTVPGAQRVLVVPSLRFRLTLPVTHTGVIYRILEQHHATITVREDMDIAAGGGDWCSVQGRVDKAECAVVQAKVREGSRATALFEILTDEEDDAEHDDPEDTI
jgi:putative IMPACT (imprinted ancient) family translation regulator